MVGEDSPSLWLWWGCFLARIQACVSSHASRGRVLPVSEAVAEHRVGKRWWLTTLHTEERWLRAPAGKPHHEERSQHSEKPRHSEPEDCGYFYKVSVVWVKSQRSHLNSLHNLHIHTLKGRRLNVSLMLLYHECIIKMCHMATKTHLCACVTAVGKQL